MTQTPDRLAEVLHQMATFQDGNAQPHTIALINELTDVAQSISTDLDKAQQEIEALRKSGAAILNEKHKEAREGALWFTRAQEWKHQLKTVLDREAETHVRHDAKVDALEGRIVLLEAENVRLRAAIELSLQCTPSIKISGVTRGVTQRAIAYDCGDPWEILSAALNQPKESGNEG